ncbi:hypothetical protein AOLI_G00087770 [Acnodon oligacanthus]
MCESIRLPNQLQIFLKKLTLALEALRAERQQEKRQSNPMKGRSHGAGYGAVEGGGGWPGAALRPSNPALNPHRRASAKQGISEGRDCCVCSEDMREDINTEAQLLCTRSQQAKHRHDQHTIC